MRRFDLAKATAVLAAALAFTPASRARENGPTPEEPQPTAPAAEAPAPEAPVPPTPEPPAPPAPEAAPAPAPGAPPPPAPPPRRAGPPLRPLDATLTYERWQAMGREERLTFVDGAVLALTDVTVRLRQALAGNGRIPPDTLKALVEFVEGYYPKLPPLVYMQEMDRIYMTAEGRTLSMLDCFRQAFRRMNGR